LFFVHLLWKGLLRRHQGAARRRLSHRRADARPLVPGWRCCGNRSQAALGCDGHRSAMTAESCGLRPWAKLQCDRESSGSSNPFDLPSPRVVDGAAGSQCRVLAMVVRGHVSEASFWVGNLSGTTSAGRTGPWLSEVTVITTRSEASVAWSQVRLVTTCNFLLYPTVSFCKYDCFSLHLRASKRMIR